LILSLQEATAKNVLSILSNFQQAG